MPPQTNSNASPNSLNFEARGTFLGTVKLLTPYIWPTDRADLKLRVMLAIVCMIASKFVTIAIPYAFKYATDALAHGARRPPQLLARGADRHVRADRALRRVAHPDGADASRAATRCLRRWR